jgi:hypothetical protein
MKRRAEARQGSRFLRLALPLTSRARRYTGRTHSAHGLHAGTDSHARREIARSKLLLFRAERTGRTNAVGAGMHKNSKRRR